MANQMTPSDEEIQLARRARRRLIGAVTLVTIMVVTLPMVLDGEQKQPIQDIVITVPPQTPGNDFSSKITQAPLPSAPQPVQETAPQPELLPKKAAPAPAKEQKPLDNTEKTPKNAMASHQTPQSKAPPKQAETPPPPEKHAGANPATKNSFIIRLGAFANPENAKNRQAKLKELGIRFYTEKAKDAGGEKLRVRAGPFTTLEEAGRVQAKLKAADIQDGMIAENKE